MNGHTTKLTVIMKADTKSLVESAQVMNEYKVYKDAIVVTVTQPIVNLSNGTVIMWKWDVNTGDIPKLIYTESKSRINAINRAGHFTSFVIG